MRQHTRLLPRSPLTLLAIAAIVVIVGALGVRFAVAQVASKSFSNPEAGMSDSQREALHQQQRSEFISKYQSWLANLDLSKIDLSKVPRQSINAEFTEPEPTLAAATSKAEDIVVVAVESIRPTAFSGTPTTLRVDQAIKGGTLPATIDITQGGSLMPATADYQGVVIKSDDNAPFLVPGDQAVLFLSHAQGSLWIQSFSGYYKITNGVVHTLRPDSFVAQFEGKPVADVVNTMQQAVQASP